MKDLHVVGVPGIRKLIEDYQLHHSAQVVSVRIEQLPAKSAVNYLLVSELWQISS